MELARSREKVLIQDESGGLCAFGTYVCLWTAIASIAKEWKGGWNNNLKLWTNRNNHYSFYMTEQNQIQPLPSTALPGRKERAKIVYSFLLMRGLLLYSTQAKAHGGRGGAKGQTNWKGFYWQKCTSPFIWESIGRRNISGLGPGQVEMATERKQTYGLASRRINNSSPGHSLYQFKLSAARYGTVLIFFLLFTTITTATATAPVYLPRCIGGDGGTN
jgi:hypothetical protein